MSAIPGEIQNLLAELEANRRSRKSAWATLQRLRKFLKANGARITIPDAQACVGSGNRYRVGGAEETEYCIGNERLKHK
jgi:hypothetical protein